MHRNFILIIIGIIIVIAITAFYIQNQTQAQIQKQALIDNKPVNPNESISETKEVRSGQKMQLLIHYPIFGTLLNAKITDPNGMTVIDVNSTNYDRELYSTFKASDAGKYTIKITNYASQSVPVHVIFSNIENSTQNNS